MAKNENHLGNIVAGVLLGALIGAGLGLGVCIVIFDEPLFFPGDTVVAGSLVCGTLGLFLGEGFIEWLNENWWNFW